MLATVTTNTILVNISLADSLYDNESLNEFRELALAAGATPTQIITGNRHTPDAKFFVGSGKASEILHAIKATSAELVLFNHNLSPSQERNLERFLQCRVLDRTGLILDLFAQRARTFEGKLQVELAQLQYLSTHLVRGWSHLERQRGGIGLRGPGETQLEVDRRLIKNRIKTLQKRLGKVRQQRHQGRRARHRSQLPSVSLVGYTNAGKSTLFNHLTGAEVFVANQPFATLDPTLRRAELPNNNSVILADTVGFIRDLPHDLVEAFRATLEETREADLLIHVVDAHNPQKNEQIAQVNNVLKQIGAHHVQQLIVCNKIDLLDNFAPRLERDDKGKPWRVWISAAANQGIDLLKQALLELTIDEIIEQTIILTQEKNGLRALLYQMNCVKNESYTTDGNYQLTVQLSRKNFLQFFPELFVDSNFIENITNE